MDRDELLRMLDLKPTSSKAGKDIVQPAKGAKKEEQPNRPRYSNVLDLTEWDKEQGQRCLDTCPRLRAANIGPDAAADFFAAAFMQNPELVDGQCVDATRQRFVETLLDSPEYKVLHESTRANRYAAELATTELGLQFAQLKAQEEQSKPDQPGKERKCGRAVAQGLYNAQERVEEAQETQAAFGIGSEDNTNAAHDSKETARVFERVRNSHTLKRICELAGRYRMAAQAKQRQKVTHGYDDMVGVELAGDPGRLLPLERVMLADEDFELDAMRRLVEKQSMCREYRGVERIGKGPIVVCVDESGSMSGEKIANAKAFALAMAWIARHQNRWCYLVSFSSGPEAFLVALNPRKWSQSDLMTWLEHFYSGGTTLDVPMETVPARWEEFNGRNGKADIIIVTDGLVHIADHARKAFNAWKAANKVRAISLVLDCGSTGSMDEISDEAYAIPNLSVDCDAVQSCLSI